MATVEFNLAGIRHRLVLAPVPPDSRHHEDLHQDLPGLVLHHQVLPDEDTDAPLPQQQQTRQTHPALRHQLQVKSDQLLVTICNSTTPIKYRGLVRPLPDE